MFIGTPLIGGNGKRAPRKFSILEVSQQRPFLVDRIFSYSDRRSSGLGNTRLP